MRSYVDANILIDYLRGNLRALGLLDTLVGQNEDLWISAAQRAEVVFYVRRGEEQPTNRLMSFFSTHPVTEEIVDVGAALYRRWHPSHGVGINDAILAATVNITGGRIITQNVRHFPMADITVEQGWDPRSQT